MTDWFEALGLESEESDLADVYAALGDDTLRCAATSEQTLPSWVDADPFCGRLNLPLDSWRAESALRRAIPALVAVEAELTADERSTVARVLVGLDVLMTMFDAFIDTRDAERDYRLALAVNVAYASQFAFLSVPDVDRETVRTAVADYFLTSARIPLVERYARPSLRAVGTEREAMDVLGTVYDYRAADIDVFAAIPALLGGLDDETAARIRADLRTHRAHYLVYDDVRDVEQDRRDGIETPIRWLLRTYPDTADVVELVDELLARYEYSGAGYCAELETLERRPADLPAALTESSESVGRR
ncbi:hypothetical protein [Halogeometricum limi]|uniref:Uncharacterized protein n=1 Tax=Halogeometricum limi TaxID=555875 RepID=A0A1I6IJ66_9EURY|nr:hypothetical protein [Halogeometricum limi]SFR66714.1 hypothetical protein SAMN04488124_3276 [Halogeometricum limi]